MFNRATSFNQPLNKWNVSNVTNMACMFYGASSFNQPLNNWNVSKVTNMYSPASRARPRAARRGRARASTRRASATTPRGGRGIFQRPINKPTRRRSIRTPPTCAATAPRRAPCTGHRSAPPSAKSPVPANRRPTARTATHINQLKISSRGHGTKRAPTAPQKLLEPRSRRARLFERPSSLPKKVWRTSPVAPRPARESEITQSRPRPCAARPAAKRP